MSSIDSSIESPEGSFRKIFSTIDLHQEEADDAMYVACDFPVGYLGISPVSDDINEYPPPRPLAMNVLTQRQMMMTQSWENSTTEISSTTFNNSNLQLQGQIHGSVDRMEVESQSSRLTLGLISKLQTFVNFFKGSVGTGLLALPAAFKHAGLLSGTLGTIFLGFLCTYCMHQLLSAYRMAAKRRHTTRPMDYGEVVEFTFLNAPYRPLRRISTAARLIANAFIISSQLGVCCVYLVFCPKIIQQVVESEFPVFSEKLDFIVYQVAVLAILLPYCCVRRLGVLSVFATIANFLVAICLVAVFNHLFRNLQAVENLPLVTDLAGNLRFFGSTLFAFESINLVLPIENRMKDRDAFGRWNGVLSLTMTIVTCLYTALGFYGYLAYGADAQVILINLPHDWFFNTTRILWATSVVMTFNHQLLAPVTIIWPFLMRHPIFPNRLLCEKYGQYILRIVLVLCAFSLAVLVPCLEQMISLIGALTMSSLAFSIPAILELVSQLKANNDNDVIEAEIASDDTFPHLTASNNSNGYSSTGEILMMSPVSRQDSVIVAAMRQAKRKLAKPPFWIVALRNSVILLLGVIGSLLASYVVIAELIGRHC